MNTRSPLTVAIVGCGTAGPAAATLLARDGHRVKLFERAESLEAVGAGFLLQPTGLAVLDELGVLPQVAAAGASVDRLRCLTRSGRRILNLEYGELADNGYAIGIHRATFLNALMAAFRKTDADIAFGCEIRALRVASDYRVCLVDHADRSHGPYDLVIVAAGARSSLRDQYHSSASSRQYPWGALWFVGRDERNQFGRELYQVVNGTRQMVGFLPTGNCSERRIFSRELFLESAVCAILSTDPTLSQPMENIGHRTLPPCHNRFLTKSTILIRLRLLVTTMCA